jgi:hypothetical protein
VAQANWLEPGTPQRINGRLFGECGDNQLAIVRNGEVQQRSTIGEIETSAHTRDPGAKH